MAQSQQEKPQSVPRVGRGVVRGFWARTRALIRAIEDNDEAGIENAVLRLSQSHRIFAPLAFLVSAFALLFNGLKLIVTNWRLLLVQILPAMWIWLAMFDLKVHVLHGKSFHTLRGPILVPIAALIVGITIASYFLNAVFAFSIAGDRPPRVRPAVTQARTHVVTIVLAGGIIGVALALATLVASRHPHPWFALSLGIVVGVMMLTYVSVPARLIGIKPQRTPREKLTVGALGGALGATVCTPPYVLGRVGLLMLGSRVLLVPGIILVVVGVTLQAGATGAVRAIKMTTKLGVKGQIDEPAATSVEP